MEFALMDATRLDNIPSSCFDLIMDKGGPSIHSSMDTYIY